MLCKGGGEGIGEWRDGFSGAFWCVRMLNGRENNCCGKGEDLPHIDTYDSFQCDSFHVIRAYKII